MFQKDLWNFIYKKLDEKPKQYSSYIDYQNRKDLLN